MIDQDFRLLAPDDAEPRPEGSNRALAETVAIVRQLIQNPEIDNARRGPLRVSDANVTDLGRFAKKAANETITGLWTFNTGTAAAPAIALPGSVGIFRGGTNRLSLVAGGVERVSLTTDGTLVVSDNATDFGVGVAAGTVLIGLNRFLRGANPSHNGTIRLVGSNAGGTAVLLGGELTGTVPAGPYSVRSEWDHGINMGAASPDHDLEIGQNARLNPLIRLRGSSPALRMGGTAATDWDVELKRAAADVWEMPDSLLVSGDHYIELNSYAVSPFQPPAPAANKGRLFMRQNGLGKAELAMIFPSGTVVAIVSDV